MVIRSQENLIGAWAFLIGVVLAVIIGLAASTLMGPLLLGILAIFGLIVGYFVAEKDVQTFLLASVSLVIVSYTGISGLVLGSEISGLNLGKLLSSVLQTLLALFVPATIVVALKTVFSIAKS
ncbi:MAG: hypothetical protein AABX07_03040 [Nanoarchaeota archaeon]